MIEDKVMAALKSSLTDKKDQAVLNGHQIGEPLLLTDIELTSLRMVEVCMHLEESLGIDIDLEDFQDAKSLSDIVALCAELQGDSARVGSL